MISLFPGFIGYCLLLAGIMLLCPILPWKNPLVRGIAACIAVYFNLNYLWWRFHDTLPPTAFTAEFLWAALIFATELMAVLQTSFHTLLFIKLSNHTPEADRQEGLLRQESGVPEVDIFLPTFNESWEVLHPALYAVFQVDWPNYTVWVLDDGNRDWLRDKCELYGVNYRRRDKRTGYKAGNINNGMKFTTGDYALSIDVDFSIYPNILYRTVGMMLSDPKIAIVQCPPNFQNADPIQWNMMGENAWPEEQRVFCDIAESARDSWDEAFCCGSVFLARRSALADIGGIPENSITEDLYSSYTLRAAGYKVRYLNETLCKGLAAESLASYLRQRCRWAVGSIQCLYLENGPIRGKNLSLKSRFFYLDPIFFYLNYFFPFLMLWAPAVYWWTGLAPFNASGGHLLRMLVPRMVVSVLSLYWLTGRKVVPVAAEIGRTVGILYYIPSILSGIFRPFGHAYRVTVKGVTRDTYVAQWHPIRGLLIVAGITIAGMVVNLTGHGWIWLLWDQNAPQVMAFTIYNLWIIFLACLACIERPLNGFTRSQRATTTGSMSRTASALLRRIFA